MLEELSRTPSAPPLYRQLARRLEAMIASRTFPPGARLPSVRRLHEQLAVSVTTVMEAYRTLEDRGLVESRPRSGVYVRVPPPRPPTPRVTAGSDEPVTLSTGELVLRLFHDAGDLEVVPFGAAVPHPAFLPTEQLSRILAREVRRRPERTHAYDSIRGFTDLRVQIARRMLDAGCAVDADDIVTTNGARHALYLALRAVARPGDTVMLETPTYSGFLLVLEALGLRALEVATDPHTGIRVDAAADALRRLRVAACVLVPSFGNPLGHCMPEANRQALVTVLGKAGVPLIEDDVYGELAFAGRRPRAAKAFDRSGDVLLCSSFSKTVAPGYRVGWLLPGRFRDAVERYKYVTSVATPAPTQMALAAYLESGGYDRQLRRLRRSYYELQERFTDAITRHFPPGTGVTRPEGGHVLWLELSPRVDALSLHRRARERGISLSPGPVFSASGGYRNFIRLNYAVPWSAAVERALEVLGGLAGTAEDGERVT